MLEETNRVDVRDLPIDAAASALASPEQAPSTAPSSVPATRVGTDVFISYAREDRPQADSLARELRCRGWTVWWDRRIGIGRLFSNVIERELETARCVVVLWSRHSVDSGWVRFEAMEGLSRNVLIPIRIEATRLPSRFAGLHTADLFGEMRAEQLEECVKAIASLVPPGPVPEADEIDAAAHPNRGILHFAWLGARALAILIALALAAATFWPDRVIGFFVEQPAAISVGPPVILTRLVVRHLEDPDLHPAEYSTALEIKVPSNALVRVSAGLLRLVEGAVLVFDESGKLVQSWGTAPYHNIRTDRLLDPGHTFYVSSWHKDVPDKGDSLPWHPSVQTLEHSNGSAKVYVFRREGAPDVDATVDVNVIGVAGQAR